MKLTCTVLAMVASLAVLAPLTKALPALQVGEIGEAIANSAHDISEVTIHDPDGWSYIYPDTGGNMWIHKYRTADGEN